MIRSAIASLLLAIALAAPTLGQTRELRVGDIVPLGRPEPVLASPQSIVTPAPTPTPVVASDPYGFGPWLNAYRARYGLHALAYDAGLSAWAASNNAQQNARGMGHHVMGAARRQNAGWGYSSGVWPEWTRSPAHRSALLDGGATRYGIHVGGMYHTYSAY